jgi:2-dehydropantoate 2-reductase
MGEIKSALVAGAGAIGSMVAWQIDRALPGAVSILAGGERLARYRERGFIVNGERRDFPLTDVESSAGCDLVIVACKNHHLPQVIRDLDRHVGPETLILSLLNGISSEEEIGEAFGSWRIPYAMIIGTDAGHADNRTTFSKTGTIFFGDATNGASPSPRVAAIADFLSRAGVAHSVPENMLNRLWYKYMMNVGMNQVTAVLRRPYRIFKEGTAVSEACGLMNAAMREVIAVAAKEGITLTDDDIKSVYATAQTLGDEGKTSMCQDVEAGRKTEVELFSGKLLELAGRHGVPVPVNSILYDLLRSIEKSYT